MTKRILLAAVMGTALAVSAFAQHPGGWGIGLVANAGGGWNGGGFGINNWGLSLKVPGVPVYWGLNMSIGTGYFGFGLTGDYYIFDKNLFSSGSVSLGWYLGLGGYASLAIWDSSYSDNVRVAAGVRLPIGLSFFIVRQFEIFLDIAPNLGIQIVPFDFPAGGWAGEFGLRFWF